MPRAPAQVRVPDEARSFSSYAAKGERMSGVYLPCLLRPDECASRDPLLLAMLWASVLEEANPPEVLAIGR